mgnify:CR=1 FL=1
MAITTVKVTIDGQEHSLTYSDSSGKWEATLTAPSKSSYNQPNHYYNVTVLATDNAGNSTQVDANSPEIGESLRLQVKEKVKPTISITSPGEGSLLITGTPEITVQLRDDDSGISIDTFALKIDSGEPVGSTSPGVSASPVEGGYDITYTPQEAMADGAHTITVNVSDNDGNAADPATRNITVDTVAPTLNVTSPAEGLVTNQTNIAVTGMTNDITSGPVTVTITLNSADQGAVTVQEDGAFSKDIVLAEGANVIVVTATDRAGKSTSVTRNVEVNTTAPKITAVEIVPNPADAGATYIIKVTVE